MASLTEWRSLLGKRVTVTLERSDGRRPQVIVVGQLLSLADSGEATVLMDDGFAHYCWPMLSVEAVTDPTTEHDDDPTGTDDGT